MIPIIRHGGIYFKKTFVIQHIDNLNLIIKLLNDAEEKIFIDSITIGIS